jgi:hypothetical protein
MYLKPSIVHYRCEDLRDLLGPVETQYDFPCVPEIDCAHVAGVEFLLRGDPLEICVDILPCPDTDIQATTATIQITNSNGTFTDRVVGGWSQQGFTLYCRDVSTDNSQVFPNGVEDYELVVYLGGVPADTPEACTFTLQVAEKPEP